MLEEGCTTLDDKNITNQNMRKINEDDLIIMELTDEESKNMIKVTTEDDAIHYFPTYAFEFLLELMQSCKDVSDVMEYADLLNKHMMTEDEEDC